MCLVAGPDYQNSPELGTYCGRPGPFPLDPIESLSNFMTLVFHTDSGLQASGFNLTYQQGKNKFVFDIGVPLFIYSIRTHTGYCVLWYTWGFRNSQDRKSNKIKIHSFITRLVCCFKTL